MDRGGVCPVCLEDYDFQAHGKCKKPLSHERDGCNCEIAARYVMDEGYSVCTHRNEQGYPHSHYVHEKSPLRANREGET